MIRFSESQISLFYRHVASYAGLPNDRRRLLYCALPVAAMCLALVLRSELLFWLGGLGLIVGAYFYFKPDFETEQYRSNIKRFEGALADWRELCEQTNPLNPIAVGAQLLPGEKVYFSGTSERWVERFLGQTTTSKTSGRMASAVVGGAIAGPVGAIIGSAGSKRTIGTSTNVYGLAKIDTGNLIITNQRMLFLGTRDTVEIASGRIMRFSVSSAQPYRITAEYAGREPGEQYSVDYRPFALNMKRRANLDFGSPEPPMPLPSSARFEYPYVTLALETSRT